MTLVIDRRINPAGNSVVKPRDGEPVTAADEATDSKRPPQALLGVPPGGASPGEAYVASRCCRCGEIILLSIPPTDGQPWTTVEDLDPWCKHGGAHLPPGHLAAEGSLISRVLDDSPDNAAGTATIWAV